MSRADVTLRLRGGGGRRSRSAGLLRLSALVSAAQGTKEGGVCSGARLREGGEED